MSTGQALPVCQPALEPLPPPLSPDASTSDLKQTCPLTWVGCVAQGEKAMWAQDLMSAHVRRLSQQQRGDRLVVPILGTTHHTDASLCNTSSRDARAALLPLCVPLLSDMQCPNHGMLRCLPQEKVVVPLII